MISPEELFFTCLLLSLLTYGLSLLMTAAKKNKMALLFFVLGFLIHTFCQISRGWYLSIFTPNAILEEVYFLPWSLSLLALIFWYLKGNQSVISSVLPLIIIFTGFALVYPGGVAPPTPQEETIFSPLFFASEVMAHAFFLLGGWFAFLYLNRKDKGDLFHTCLLWGFILYSFSQIIGAIWAYLGWAAPLHWSERHLQSASIWCFYAAYIHLRFLSPWTLKKKAWFAVFGLLLVLAFTYGHHFAEMDNRIG